MERTYIMIKPDGVQRGLVAEIMKRFEQKGFKLVGEPAPRARPLPRGPREPFLAPTLRRNPERALV